MIVAVVATPMVMTALAGPADAHGAMGNPISRTVACGPEGGRSAESKACKAARAVSDAQALRAWDNLRVAGVAGRDRQMIPDGKLCSGGLEAYQGLDLARTDWPATRLSAGARFTFTYPATIPHRGSFRLYITRSGYEPTRRLRWSDLEPRPFASVADPPMREGAYIIKGRLPRGKSGRHIIYAVWQNSDTPDTYYSCSDVVFGARSGAAVAKRTTQAPTYEIPAPDATTIGAANRSSNSVLPLAAGGGAVVVALAAAGAVLLTRRRHRRADRP